MVAVLAALLLVLVPTLFSIFPSWTTWTVGLRVAIVVVWFGGAAIVAWATARQAELVEDLVEGPSARRAKARSAATRELIRALQQPGASDLPGHYELRLFLPDDEGILRHVYGPASSTPSSGWRSGRGVTGKAWEINGFILVTGARVSDGTFGLSREQQQRYAHLEVVAATPVETARGAAIGILTASSTTNDEFFEHPDGKLTLVSLAAVIARVLIDVAQVATD